MCRKQMGSPTCPDCAKATHMSGQMRQGGGNWKSSIMGGMLVDKVVWGEGQMGDPACRGLYSWSSVFQRVRERTD